METTTSPWLGFLRAVFLVNHLASNDNLTRTTKRQNIYQCKLMQHQHVSVPNKQHKTHSKETYAKRERGQTEPGLVACYDIRPGNGRCLFFQPRSPHGASRQTWVSCECRLCESCIWLLVMTATRCLSVLHATHNPHWVLSSQTGQLVDVKYPSSVRFCLTPTTSSSTSWKYADLYTPSDTQTTYNYNY